MIDHRKIEALAVRNAKKEIKKTDLQKRLDLADAVRELVERQKEEMFIAAGMK